MGHHILTSRELFSEPLESMGWATKTKQVLCTQKQNKYRVHNHINCNFPLTYGLDILENISHPTPIDLQHPKTRKQKEHKTWNRWSPCVLTHTLLPMLPESRLCGDEPCDWRHGEAREALLLCLMTPAYKTRSSPRETLLSACMFILSVSFE